MYIDLNPLSRFSKRHKDFFLKHKDKFWWFHSIYALFFGMGVMWLGHKNFQYIRLAVVQIIFIWLSSLGVPLILAHPKIELKWKHRIRLLINYFNRNFYQQILFFVIPIYYMSTTLDSINVIFLGLVAVSAVFSTMDIVYDRFISVKGAIMSLFFAFNLFVCINIMLPFVWHAGHLLAIRLSAVFSFLGFASFCLQLVNLKKKRKWFLVGAAAVLLLMISEFGRPFIPPAPLRMEQTRFGRGVAPKSLELVHPLEILPANGGKIYAQSVVLAPQGFQVKVRHTWYLDGRKIYTSPLFEVTGIGGRGYRFWTYYTLKSVKENSVLMIDLETGEGQLVGRSRLGTIP